MHRIQNGEIRMRGILVFLCKQTKFHVNMLGVNCSIVGCKISQRFKYQGCGIYKLLSGEDEFETSWGRITLNKQTCQLSLPSSINVPASSCYQTYDEFRKRIQTLSLPSCWDICI